MFTIGRNQGEPRGSEHVQMRASGNQNHLPPVCVQPGADGATDATGTVDDETHGPMISQKRR
jgi:hypothetical protein